MLRAYYNDSDKFCVQWLRNLIREGLIPDGEVDGRSICDVRPDDLVGYAQCHFFAGIGGWAYALQLSGWGDRPAWTGSCPCQPFSVAGKRKAQSDERHLWPEWFRLIRARRPEHVFFEQVAGAIRHGWLDGVFADLEAEGYSCGAAVLGAHSVGAPHIRQRLYGVAESMSAGRTQRWTGAGYGPIAGSGGAVRLADSLSPRLEERQGEPGDAGTERATVERDCDAGGVDDAEDPRRAGQRERGSTDQARDDARLQEPSGRGASCCLRCGKNRFTDYGRCFGGRDHWYSAGGVEYTERNTGGPRRLATESTEGPGATGERSPDEPGRPSMPWDHYDVIPCLDGKARRIGKRALQMVDGTAGSLGAMCAEAIHPLTVGEVNRAQKLRAYGNAIVVPLAAEFIRAYMELTL